jgi:hypothetical protein
MSLFRFFFENLATPTRGLLGFIIWALPLFDTDDYFLIDLPILVHPREPSSLNS